MRAVLIALLCLVLAACGTKPKDLKGNDNFPHPYPQAE
jgi:starvation-inducible outer membrane lipoprotein